MLVAFCHVGMLGLWAASRDCTVGKLSSCIVMVGTAVEGSTSIADSGRGGSGGRSSGSSRGLDGVDRAFAASRVSGDDRAEEPSSDVDREAANFFTQTLLLPVPGILFSMTFSVPIDTASLPAPSCATCAVALVPRSIPASTRLYTGIACITPSMIPPDMPMPTPAMPNGMR